MTKKIKSLRLTDYLKELWDEERGDKRLPSLQSISEAYIEKTVMDDVFIIEVSHKLNNHFFSIKYIGENLKKMHEDTSDKDIKSTNQFIQKYNRHLERTITSRCPVVQNIEVYQGINKTLKYRQILLPLGDSADGPVNAILGGMRCKQG